MNFLKRRGELEVQILSRMVSRICFNSSPAEGGSVLKVQQKSRYDPRYNSMLSSERAIALNVFRELTNILNCGKVDSSYETLMNHILLVEDL